MKQIGTHISTLRMLINKYSRTQEGYTDENLYNLFSACRAVILKRQFEKLSFISDFNWYSFCMSLEINKHHNCDCVPDELNCNILKSKYKIPSVIDGMNVSKIKIFTIGGKQINIITEDGWRRKQLKEPTDYYGSIINGYLIIWNAPLKLKVVTISGVWSDVLSLESIPGCDSDGTVTPNCYDPLTTEYPLQEELAVPVYLEVLRLLNIPMQGIPDLTNDSNEFSKI